MKPPHQVNLVIWVNEGKDEPLVSLIEEVLYGLSHPPEIAVIHAQTDPLDESDRGWYWHGVKVSRSAE